MWIVVDLAEQCGVCLIGRCDGKHTIAAAVLKFPFSLPHTLARGNITGHIGPQLRTPDKFLLRSREDGPGIAEEIQQMYDTPHAKGGSHRQGNIFDLHSAKI